MQFPQTNYMIPNQQQSSLAQQAALAAAIEQLDNNPVNSPAGSAIPNTSVNPQALAALLGGNSNNSPTQPVLDASMQNGQGPTMLNDATLQGLSNPNASSGDAATALMAAQNNTANVNPWLMQMFGMGGQNAGY